MQLKKPSVNLQHIDKHSKGRDAIVSAGAFSPCYILVLQVCYSTWVFGKLMGFILFDYDDSSLQRLRLCFGHGRNVSEYAPNSPEESTHGLVGTYS